MNDATARPDARSPKAGEARLSLLIELRGDRPGALAAALQPFVRHRVSLTHIESRPATGGGRLAGKTFDFYVDCEGDVEDANIRALLADLHLVAADVVVLEGKDVPWFPRHIAELDRVANNTLNGGSELEADHPGFADRAYRRRRDGIDRLARDYRHGDAFPVVDYTATEHATWREAYRRLAALHRDSACVEYQQALAALEAHCGYRQGIPQGRDVSAFLKARTGFQLRPVAGLLGARDFLNGLAFRVFFATQYVRHPSKPFYTPEPDVCHELIGHAPMFADPAFADLSQEIGLASLGASDHDIERLARCYWFSVEFGLLRDGREAGAVRAYGAGLLSSFGELRHACSADANTTFKPWRPEEAASRSYPITEYQPLYFVADSLHDAKERMRAFCQSLPRPFYARYNAVAERIWVDRAVRRAG